VNRCLKMLNPSRSANLILNGGEEEVDLDLTTDEIAKDDSTRRTSMYVELFESACISFFQTYSNRSS
jgi:hypothetical protein